MTKIRRYLESGATYFVTSVTKNRAPIFLDKTAARFLIATFGFYRYYFNFKLYGYVVMPDHCHLLIQPDERYNISTIMKNMKGNFSRKYNEMFNHKGIIWQQGFYDKGLRDIREIKKWLDYMHYNPIEKGLVVKSEDYEFSSYHQYFGKIRQKMQALVDKILI